MRLKSVGLSACCRNSAATGGNRVSLSRGNGTRRLICPKINRRKIAAELVTYARSLIANDGTSIRETLELASKRLCRLSLEAGTKLLVRDLQPVCGLNTKWAARHDLDSYQLIYWKKKDNKKLQDKVVPRVRRGLHPVPMGLLIGDVHYVDILVEEAGEPVCVRLIAWLDASSMFVWVMPVFLSKGKGIRQEDVAESLAQVTTCPQGGHPARMLPRQRGRVFGTGGGHAAPCRPCGP